MMTMITGLVVRAVFFLTSAWAAITALFAVLPWTPPETAMQSAKIVLLPASALVLAVCAFGAVAALLGLSGMWLKRETAPRPYNPAATPPA